MLRDAFRDLLQVALQEFPLRSAHGGLPVEGVARHRQRLEPGCRQDRGKPPADVIADDQLYKVSRELFRSQAVVFFVSVRWGQANSVYQRLFERLSWIENRFSTLGEAPIPQLRKLEAGIVVFGQNWNDVRVLETQKQNFEWFGWKTPAALSFAWQYTRDADEESPASYLGAIEEFDAFLDTDLPGEKPRKAVHRRHLKP